MLGDRHKGAHHAYRLASKHRGYLGLSSGPQVTPGSLKGEEGQFQFGMMERWKEVVAMLAQQREGP